MKRMSGKYKGVYQRCTADCPADRCSRHTWSFQVEVRGHGGKRRQVTKGGFDGPKAAYLARAEIVRQHGNGTLPTDDKITFGDHLKVWLAARIKAGELKPSTARSYIDLAEKHLIPRVGHHRLSQLRAHHLTTAYREIVADRNAERAAIEARNAAWLAASPKRTRAPYPVPRPISPASVRRIHAVASGALTSAVKGGKINVNPAANVELPKATKRKVQPWTPEEYGAFLDVTKDHGLYPAFLLVGLTGLRRGELCGLQWPDVDLDGGRLTVQRTRVSVGYKVLTGDAKSEAGQERVIPLGPAAVDVLRALKRRQAADRLKAGGVYKSTGWVICDALGRPTHPETLTKTWKRLAGRAGLPPTKLHAGRHFFVAAMISAGKDIGMVSKLAGHASVAVTADVYGSLFDVAARDATEAVETMIPGISLANQG